MGSLHGSIIGGQNLKKMEVHSRGSSCLYGPFKGGVMGAKAGVHLWGYYWGPGCHLYGPFKVGLMGAKTGFHLWGPFERALLGAKDREVGSIHGVFIGGQGPGSGVHSWGLYWGPGTGKWGPFVGSLLGARGRKMGSIHWGINAIIEEPGVPLMDINPQSGLAYRWNFTDNRYMLSSCGSKRNFMQLDVEVSPPSTCLFNPQPNYLAGPFIWQCQFLKFGPPSK